MKDDEGRRDPVKKNMDLLHKPRTFRDRRKEAKLGEAKRDHPKHPPYKREQLDLFYEDED